MIQYAYWINDTDHTHGGALHMEDKLPLVEEVLKYHEDIEPYKYIKIYSGVGSGKTRFACKMILGDKELGIPKKPCCLLPQGEIS